MVPFVKSRGAGFSTGRKIVARRRFIQGEEEGEEEGGRRKGEIRAWVFVTRRYFSRTSKRIDILCRSREKGNVPFVVGWLFSPGRTKTSVDPTRSRIERGREKERRGREKEREWRSFVTRQNSSEENGSSWRLLRRGEAVIHPMHSVELDRNIQRVAWMGLHALHEWTFAYLYRWNFFRFLDEDVLNIS